MRTKHTIDYEFQPGGGYLFECPALGMRATTFGERVDHQLWINVQVNGDIIARRPMPFHEVKRAIKAHHIFSGKKVVFRKRKEHEREEYSEQRQQADLMLSNFAVCLGE